MASIRKSNSNHSIQKSSLLSGNEKAYPENRMFGSTLPAYGLYVRHARNIYLDNVPFHLRQPDARPALVLDDAKEVILRSFKDTHPEGK